jgi:NAD(P)-dependent dehydrogenase (short-subunit alcohol dehydrogenase family)
MSRYRKVVLALLGAAAIAPGWALAQTAGSGGELTMKGKTVLITGSTDGLGREVARRVAARAAHVIVHGRNQERGKAVVDEIAKEGKGTARFYAADLASLAEVRTLADTLKRDYKRIDVLVNNAGVLSMANRQVSKDGHELHFAVNYLAGFLLTRSLLPTVTASAPSRIVNVASVAQSPIDFSDVMLERPGRASQGYGQSKLAQILFTVDLAEELKGKNVVVTALHPATMMDTTMVKQSGMQARATVDEGATAVMQQITGTVESGQYYNGLQAARPNAQAFDANARAQLRALSQKLTGVQ